MHVVILKNSWVRVQLAATICAIGSGHDRLSGLGTCPPANALGPSSPARQENLNVPHTPTRWSNSWSNPIVRRGFRINV